MQQGFQATGQVGTIPASSSPAIISRHRAPTLPWSSTTLASGCGGARQPGARFTIAWGKGLTPVGASRRGFFLARAARRAARLGRQLAQKVITPISAGGARATDASGVLHILVRAIWIRVQPNSQVSAIKLDCTLGIGFIFLFQSDLLKPQTLPFSARMQ